jgi:hypothetical protein
MVAKVAKIKSAVFVLQRLRKTYRFSVEKLLYSPRLLLMLIVISVLLHSSHSVPQNLGFHSLSSPGQSSTLLPNGHWLLLGGESPDGKPSALAVIWDPANGQSSLLAPLSHARAWHTGTIQPDGTIFIFGGIGSNGKLVEAAEIFDPETQTF